MKFVFKYQKFDYIGRLVDFFIIMVLPMIIIILLKNSFAQWLELIAFLYYGLVIIFLNMGVILHPDKNPLILGWYINKISKKELAEFGKPPVNYPVQEQSK